MFVLYLFSAASFVCRKYLSQSSSDLLGILTMKIIDATSFSGAYSVLRKLGAFTGTCVLRLYHRVQTRAATPRGPAASSHNKMRRSMNHVHVQCAVRPSVSF